MQRASTIGNLEDCGWLKVSENCAFCCEFISEIILWIPLVLRFHFMWRYVVLTV